MASTKADFSQRDPKWSGEKLGFANWQTMGGYGCLVTAMANVAQAHGKDVSPSDVNRMLKDKGQYVVDAVGEKSDVAGPGALSKLFPDIANVENKNWGSAPADINYFDIRSSKTDDIIVLLDYHPARAGMQSHYCRVIGINAARNDVEIVDSYTGRRIWVSSLGLPASRLIYRAYRYRGPGSGFVSSVPPTSQPSNQVGIRLNGDRFQKWNVRTSPDMGKNVRTDGYGVGGQTYGAEIVDGWAKVNFMGKTGYFGPKAFSRA